MKISLIQPSRNNLKYLKWSYDAIRKNQGEHTVQICVADDASTDGTWEWCLSTMDDDPHFNAVRNNGDERLGHTILYDLLINEVAKHDRCMIYHADMYLCPGALDSVAKYLEPRTIVSLTRIEPPLHPDGPEKILQHFGVEPEEFNEQGLLDFVMAQSSPQKATGGIFAPWAFWKKDFQKIGGHDPLYAPQSREDSDIFSRFQLDGVKFIQTWEGFVYHMTCRGSRRNTLDKAQNIYEDSPEWIAQNRRSERNFVRKWGHFVKHDPELKPVIPPKYSIAFVVKNLNPDYLEILEPWCDVLYHDSMDQNSIDSYIAQEQQNTIIDLRRRFKAIEGPSPQVPEPITITIDCLNFTPKDYGAIQEISTVIPQIGQLGTFKVEGLMIDIKSLQELQHTLIKCE